MMCDNEFDVDDRSRNDSNNNEDVIKEVCV